jgi:transposase InsO family protein
MPQVNKVDNGSEFVSRAMDEWTYRNGVKLELRPARKANG